MIFVIFFTIKNSLNDYYIEQDIFINSSTNNQRISFYYDYFYIYDSFFSNIKTFLGHGGAIYFNGPQKILVIESSTFQICRVATGHGGAIYYDCSSNGSVIISKSCGNECYTGDSYSYQFAMIFTGQKKNNKMIYLSLTNCAQDHTENRYQAVRLWAGNQTYEYVNTTKCKAYRHSAVRFQSPDSLIVKYCSFCKNDSKHSILMRFGGGNNNLMKNCNIIENNSPSKWGVLSNWNGAISFIDSCIFKNNTRSPNELLFFIVSGQLTFINCFIDLLKFLNTPATIIQNNTNSNLYSFSYYFTLNC